MSDYITRAELIAALRAEDDRQPDLDDTGRRTWVPDLGRVADALAAEQQERNDTIAAPGPLTVSPVIADVLRAADVWLTLRGVPQSARLIDAIEAWRAAGRPGLDT